MWRIKITPISPEDRSPPPQITLFSPHHAFARKTKHFLLSYAKSFPPAPFVRAANWSCGPLTRMNLCARSVWIPIKLHGPEAIRIDSSLRLLRSHESACPIPKHSHTHAHYPGPHLLAHTNTLYARSTPNLYVYFNQSVSACGTASSIIELYERMEESANMRERRGMKCQYHAQVWQPPSDLHVSNDLFVRASSSSGFMLMHNEEQYMSGYDFVYLFIERSGSLASTFFGNELRFANCNCW